MASRTITETENQVTTTTITDSGWSGSAPSPPGQPPSPTPSEPRYTQPASPPPSPSPADSAAFNAGVQAERQRALFALNLRTAIARRLQATAAGSRDSVAVALLQQEEKQFRTEPALPPPQNKKLSEEQQVFAHALTRKIDSVLRPEARAR